MVSEARKVSLWLFAAAGAVAAVAGMLCLYPSLEDRGDQGLDGLIEAGEIGNALTAAESLLAERPDDRRLLEVAVRLNFLVGQFDRGLEHFEALTAGMPGTTEPWLKLAALHEDAFRFKEAASAASKALGIDSSLLGARAHIARYSLRTNRYEEAEALLEPGVRAGTADMDEQLTYGHALVRLRRHEDAVGVLQEAVTSSEADADDLCAFAEALIGQGEFQQGADVAARVLEGDPSLSRPYYLLGTALARQRRTDSASQMLQIYSARADLDARWSKAREMDGVGLRNRACYERASALAELRQYARAVAQCARAVALDPDDGPVLFAAVRKFAECEAYEEARDVLADAVERGVEPAADFLALLGEYHRRAGDVRKARELLDRSLQSDPQNFNALIWRARAALEGGEEAETAAGYAERAKSLEPGEWEPLYWLGRAALARDRPADAHSYFRQTQRLGRGTNADLLVGMGDVALRAGSAKDAIGLFLRAARMDAGSLRAFEGLEQAMLALNDAERAATARERLEKVAGVKSHIERIRAKPLPFEERGADFLEIGTRCQDAGMSQEAEKYLHLARATAPDRVDVHRRLAKVLSASEDVFFRLGALAAWVRLAPGEVEPRRKLALALAGIGVQLDRALTLAQEALQGDDSAESHYALANVLLARGEDEAAAAEAEAAFQGEPEQSLYRDLFESTRETGKRAQVDKPGGASSEVPEAED